ncbi:phosphodiesterase [Eisenibacter elegans]|jgi:Icc protein|uniref:phosphodiesterase n=1 Tax=Eisenibacter elegans TaxID=997 RepID=UPI00041E6F91|nr:phosphodiesterase [Eisenibacter elegans]
MYFVQITDIHLFADTERILSGPEVNPDQQFRKLLTHLQHLSPQPDFVLVSGDITDLAEQEAYHHFDTLMQPLGIPYYWLPGNHDDALLMRALCPGLQVRQTGCVAMGQVALCMLDSSVPGKSHGLLSSQSLAQLQENLTRHRDKTCLLALHHPPIPTDTWMDPFMLQNSAELFEVIDQHPQVKAVMFGHIHTDRTWQRNGVQYWVTPASSYQLQMTPSTAQYAVSSTQPGYRKVCVLPDGRLQTTVVWVA